MKSNFALSLSFDGLSLMHRVASGWHLVGRVALDNPDLTGALAGLRAAAEGLEPDGIATKLLIPNDQIKYLALDTTRAGDDEVLGALDGATPYPLADLAYDYAKGGGRTYVAAVAKDTLVEAQQFASEHGFNPVSFAAVPEPFTFVGEAFFGAVDGQTAERDAEPVIVTGDADVAIEVEATPPSEPVSTEVEAVEPVETVEEPEAFEALEPPVAPPAAPVVEIEEFVTPEVNDTADELAVEDKADEPDEPATEEGAEVEGEAEPEVDDAEPESEAEAPLFASRLRADRDEGRPSADVDEDAPVFSARRSEPAVGRQTPPALAVPTGKGTDAMPPLSAPNRDDVPDAVPPISTDAPAAENAPAITGDAPSALPPEAAVAAATLAVEPDPIDPDEIEDETAGRGAAAVALGAASAVGGAVGGMFASRRMARADAKTKAAEDAKSDAKSPDDKSRLTVFGARKQPKPKLVVGGKPRFLGLILTAILLLFLLAFAAFAALSEEGIAAWFGFGSSETQMAEDPAVEPAVSEVAAVQPSDGSDPALASDALATPTAPSGGQVLSPEEATRIYAATGVWQRAPRIPLTPRTATLDGLDLAAPSRPVPRVPPSPLASSSSVAGDALIATPIDPPAPDATFDFGSDGLVVATEEGAVTPDGILVINGRPPLNPPTRPGTVAPEITPQDQLAAVVPDTAEQVTDAPEGVIVINGRPSIEPPVRTGTVAPAVTPDATAVAQGAAPLLAADGLLVLAGSPPILPPVRPGTVATPIAVAPVLEDPAIETPLAETPDLTAPEGVNLIAGSPPILPPVRPGTVAPISQEAAVESLTSDVTAALNSGTAQTPSTDTRRPLLRPAAIVQAAVQLANTPVVGALTPSQAAAFRPRTRPAGLAPVQIPDPEPEPEPEPQEAAAPTGLQISPEIAAAVQAAANRPNPIVNPTAQAVAVSERPDTRPRNMARIVARAAETQQRAATQAAAVPQAAAVAPSGPTAGSVATNATLENAINLREVNLIGIYGGNNDRRALVRLSNGRYVRVTVGDRLDGGRVTAISSGALSYTKRGRALTLEVAG